MKKYLVVLLGVLCLFGCGKADQSNVKDEFVKNISKKNSYLVKGTMNIISNEDTFSYNVTVAKSNDNYRVNLVNTINNHEQVILRSNNEVYVVTPSLNKSFKFQSEWPDNGSQGYFIDSLVKDVKNDSESSIVLDGENYILTTKVNYPNNSLLVNEKIYLDKDYNISKVEVLDNDGNVKITVNYKSIDFKPTFKDDYFELESLIDDDVKETVINKFKAKEFKLEEGKFLGGEDFMKDYKENHKSLFVPDEPQEPIPQIVKPTGGNNPGGDTNPFKFNFMGVRPVNK